MYWWSVYISTSSSLALVLPNTISLTRSNRLCRAHPYVCTFPPLALGPDKNKLSFAIHEGTPVCAKSKLMGLYLTGPVRVDDGDGVTRRVALGRGRVSWGGRCVGVDDTAVLDVRARNQARGVNLVVVDQVPALEQVFVVVAERLTRQDDFKSRSDIVFGLQCLTVYLKPDVCS
ncbi:hypothetical protein FB567DRAFT_554612 [Paraphoma chrysanthemicola]|uniref:Uncharacterized protein n=1 Tax=Paraphoma chrysanthemicola TaxID=798071 RepID=A0A8K0VSH1_9PLEO|nr:hypothetical protein FB567DRAFT_554612 [Paraphoma chrysanthemicola]